MNKLDVTTFSVGEIRAQRVYDLAICSASWDRRCLSPLEGDWLATKSLRILRYRNLGVSEQAVVHHDLLTSGINSLNPAKAISIDSVNILRSWESVRLSLLEVSREVGRPLRIFVDMSSMPRYISLGILGFGFTSGIVEHADYLYVEAAEYETLSEESPAFTTGRWFPWPIVGLGGLSPARARTHLLVSAGFEGRQTKKLVDTMEPDRVSVLFAEPGVNRETERKAREANKSLIKAYLVPDRNVFSASLNTADAVRDLEDLLPGVPSLEGPFPEVTSYLLAGPKPHSLALAILAFDRGVGDVLYVRPEEHKETSAVRLGASWLTTVARPWA